ncbi:MULTISPECIES: class I adenylate cyclase [Pasteurellaceae]|uniref:Class I adenylate cyclase n=1 Tax=Pasteurella atlantica TaxID=2827233 RepID=A0AAW8CQP2_9PAST|nr:class I adenylate cyclase [Pasteurella atlantica]MBR0573751.1 class I adenylate cyclase [Pasteurella atlantica]MDP8039614.1 class I adenylate cyclase [Pasteurella atlantica]MDP8041705.1 class I adenylate cyclase [Pasteurella atlantica]MDP8044021.1 class I adenylate cyclase [Pasteurella atlantica]MDP8045999.1 class I adenylate cyclase [Pasteurella atlantica]
MPQLNLQSQDYSSISQIDIAIQRVNALDELRIERTLTATTNNTDFQHVFQLLTLLIHCNHPKLPAYVPSAPKGIWQFSLTPYQKQFLTKNIYDDTLLEVDEPSFDAVYAMGSTGSISQTPTSDLDIWVCSEKYFNLQQQSLIESKFSLIQEWANKFNVEIHFYLMNPNQFKKQFYYNKVTKENSGSAQHFFLLDEFYRSAIRLTGKRLLWLHLLKEEGQSYQEAIEQLISDGVDLDEWLDFGDFSALSIDEFFGASLWQLYKSINSPYKSAIKILLLESYTKTYPETNLISKQFKKMLLQDKRSDYHFDPYLAILEQVTAYLTKEQEFERLENIRRCFYIKVTEGIPQNNGSWRLNQLQELISKWQWSPEQVKELSCRTEWKVKQAILHQQTLVGIFMQSYHKLINFVRQQNITPTILSQDSDILVRQLYSTFEVLPGKVTLLNNKIKWNLAEDALTFVEAKAPKKGWYLLNHPPKIMYDSNSRYVQHFPYLIQLISWAYFNGLITPKTDLHIISKTVNLVQLRQFIADIRLNIPIRVPLPSSEAWHHPNEIQHLVVVVNLTKDPTKEMNEMSFKPSSKELFNLGYSQQKVVGSIGLIYRNMWSEIRTEYFEGENAVLDALKLLSNKLYQSTFAPHSLNVFCYSRHFNQQLQSLISALVNRCIVIQTGVNYQKQLLIRSEISNQKWQFVFGNIEINSEQAVGLSQKFTEKERLLKKHLLPKEIGEFAIEGFTQFFFEDQTETTFNVYILDEKNHLDCYLNCKGSKDKKVKLINATFAEKKAQKLSFNFPQFYQFVEKEGKKHIELFESIA